MALTVMSLDKLADLEERYSHQLPEGGLMDRAGAAIAAAIRKKAPQARSANVLCGPGNNGGDGFIAACALKQAGLAVTAILPGCDRPKTALAQRAFRLWQEAGGRTLRDPYLAEEADVVVDALFGIGLNKPIRGEWLDAVLWYNERNGLRVAVDVPSGLDAEKGTWVGGLRGCTSQMTVNLICAKAGCFTAFGPDASGEVLVDELGLSVPLAPVNITGESDIAHIVGRRLRNTHKGTYGHCVVIGGSAGFVGAPILAARAALTLGAGSVSVESPEGALPAWDPQMPELMFRKTDLSKAAAVIAGPGMGTDEAARERLAQAIETPVPLIIDADGLNLLAANPELIDRLGERRAATVLTPHPGEAARLSHRTVAEIERDRLFAAREIALQTGSIVVLKGCGTVIATTSSRAWFNPTGSAALATAGSGDVLAGMIGAFLAQKFDVVSSILGGVWLHGKAGEDALCGLTAGQIAPRAAQILARLRAIGPVLFTTYG